MTYPYDAPASAALFDRATAVVPGGVNSPVRAFQAVGGTPRFMASGRGPYLRDEDGREYVDLVCSWGPIILGHAHPAVVEALRDAAGRGTSFGTPSRGEVELAESSSRAASRRSSRCAWSTAAPRRPCPRSAWPAASPAAARSSSSPAATTATSTRCWPAPAPASPRSACRTPPASPARRPPTRSCCRTTTCPRSRPPSSSAATRSPWSSPRPPPRTWASSRRCPASTPGSRRCASGTARCSSWTRS